VLFIHHRFDDCPENSHEEALRMSKKFLKSPRVDFVTVNGGVDEQPFPCFDMTHHDFWGREKEFAQTIVDWISGKEVPPGVD
jgi:hypothetical protein